MLGNNPAFVGPTWVVTPKFVYNPQNGIDISYNWLYTTLEKKLLTTFPQTVSMAHRGKRYHNKTHFVNPNLYSMGYNKIRKFLIENEIRRVMVFTDQCNQLDCNLEYGAMYVDEKGYIRSQDPNKSDSDPSQLEIPVTNPMVYFIRDLITQTLDIKERVEIYIFQNMMHYEPFLISKSAFTKINHDKVRSEILKIGNKQQHNDKNLFDKLCITSFSDSMVDLDFVKMIYYPLVLDHNFVGEESKFLCVLTTINLDSTYLMQRLLIDSLKMNTEARPVPNLENIFALLTGNKMSDLICQLIKCENPLMAGEEADSFESGLKEHKELFFSGYSVTMYDYAAALSSMCSGFHYKIDDECIKDVNPTLLK